MKKSLVIITVTVILILIGGIIFWGIKTSPKYSLYQIKKAIDTHDIEKFKKYVDLDGIITNLIDEIIDEIENEKTDGDWEQLGKSIGAGLTKIFKPRLTQEIKQQIVNSIESIKKEKSDTIYSSNITPSVFLSSMLGNPHIISGIANIQREGKIALVGIRLKQIRYDTTLILKIKLRRLSNYWQAAELQNLIELTKTINDLEQKRIDVINEPIIKEMNNYLKIIKRKKESFYTDYWGYDKKVRFTIEIKNISNKQIIEYEGKIIITDPNHNIHESFPIRGYSDMLDPGKTQSWSWTKDIDVYNDNDKLIYNIPSNQLSITLLTNLIKFRDGKTLKLHNKWE